MSHVRLIVDTDIGSDVDDALAVLLVLHQPDVELLGITTSYGIPGLRGKIARRVLEAAGREAPVIAGRDQPLSKKPKIWLTGIEGVGLLSEEEMAAPLEEFGIQTGADAFIAETVMRYPGEVTILGIGPLTNLALALDREPEIARAARAIYVMGGGITYPKKTPSELDLGKSYIALPSHNVRCDLRAAKRVFESGAPLHIVSNDCTTRLWFEGQAIHRLIRGECAAESAAVGRLLHAWLNYRTRLSGQPIAGTCPHDALAAAELCGKSFVSYCPGVMEILCDAATRFTPVDSGHHLAAVDVDEAGFLTWFSEAVRFPQSGDCGSRSSD